MSGRQTSEPNWIPLPNPLTEEEVKLELTWRADERTSKAIERQARLMGFANPTDYLRQVVRATLAGSKQRP